MVDELEIPRRDFTVKRNTDWTQPLEWQDAAGVPVDITGLRFKMQLRATYIGETLATLDSSLNDGSIKIISEPFGSFELMLSRVLTKTLLPDVLLYDFFVISDPGGLNERWDCLFEGFINFTPSVTQGDIP